MCNRASRCTIIAGVIEQLEHDENKRKKEEKAIPRSLLFSDRDKCRSPSQALVLDPKFNRRQETAAVRRAARVGHDGVMMPEDGTAHGGYRKAMGGRALFLGDFGGLWGALGVPPSSHTHPLVAEV